MPHSSSMLLVSTPQFHLQWALRHRQEQQLWAARQLPQCSSEVMAVLSVQAKPQAQSCQRRFLFCHPQHLQQEVLVLSVSEFWTSSCRSSCHCRIRIPTDSPSTSTSTRFRSWLLYQAEPEHSLACSRHPPCHTGHWPPHKRHMDPAMAVAALQVGNG